ncbi:hypothetical protein LCGC14_2556570 [marine sediment metagenome]|uniref:Uncharacterized protein n=1 Tax=marine sediment metagenome TaxID=412755 RepID=A0A0F9ALV6_9ZZZZ
MEINKTGIGVSAAVALAMVAIVMNSGLIGEDDVYACLDNEMAMKCDKLSAVNAEGIQTRCYYDSPELNRTTYKVCKTGWVEFTKTEYSNILTEEGKLCKVYKENKLIKECKTEDNQTYLYIVGG